MCTVKVPLSVQTMYSYISHYFENKQVDEPEKTEDEAAVQEEEGIPCDSHCYEKLAVYDEEILKT